MAGALIRSGQGSFAKRGGTRLRLPLRAGPRVPLAVLEDAFLFGTAEAVLASSDVLPRPMVTGYELSPEPATIRTEFEIGSPRVRRRTAAPNMQIALAWRLSDAEFAAFRTWFADTILHGAAWFVQDLALGDGITSRECRFVGAYKARPIAGTIAYWEVSATVEARDA